MKHLKRIFEDYEEDYADDKDMVNIIQDIKDLEFKVTIAIKYIHSSEVPNLSLNRRSIGKFTPSATKDSQKCYQINISKTISSDTIDELSDLLYELQTVFSRLSDIGKVAHNIKIETNKYSNHTSAQIKLIVAVNGKIESGDNDRLSDAVKSAGYTVVPKNRGLLYIEVNKDKIKERPNNYYQNRNSRESKEWELERSQRMKEINAEWTKVKKIARDLKIPVRGSIDTNGIRVSFAPKNVKTDVKTVS